LAAVVGDGDSRQVWNGSRGERLIDKAITEIIHRFNEIRWRPTESIQSDNDADIVSDVGISWSSIDAKIPNNAYLVSSPSHCIAFCQTCFFERIVIGVSLIVNAESESTRCPVALSVDSIASFPLLSMLCWLRWLWILGECDMWCLLPVSDTDLGLSSCYFLTVAASIVARWAMIDFWFFLQIEIFIRCSYYESGGYSTGGTRVYVMVPCVMGGIMFLSKFSTASRIHSRTPSRRMKRKCYSNCLQLDCAPQFDFGLNTVFSRTAFQYQTLRASTFARNYASRVLGAMPILEKKRKPEFLCSYQNFNYKHYK
jgi:hypothetical protein